jgi:alkylhydroperoxidase family enzyme
MPSRSRRTPSTSWWISARRWRHWGWTEALTLLSQTHAPDEDYAALKPHFTEEEIVKPTLMIGVINTANRLVLGFRAVHPVAPRSEAA